MSSPEPADDRDRDRDQDGDRALRFAVCMSTIAAAVADEPDLNDFGAAVVRAAAEVCDARAATLVLRETSRPRVLAAFPDPVRAVEAAAVRHRQGPGPDCCHTRQPVIAAPLTAPRCPRLAPVAARHGLASADAVPVTAAQRFLGALVLYRGPTRPAPVDLRLAQAIAAVTGNHLARARALERGATRTARLQQALDRRVTVHQTIGVLTERWQVSADKATHALRSYARHRQQPLHLAALDVLAGRATPTWPPG